MQKTKFFFRKRGLVGAMIILRSWIGFIFGDTQKSGYLSQVVFHLDNTTTTFSQISQSLRNIFSSLHIKNKQQETKVTNNTKKPSTRAELLQALIASEQKNNKHSAPQQHSGNNSSEKYLGNQEIISAHTTGLQTKGPHFTQQKEQSKTGRENKEISKITDLTGSKIQQSKTTKINPTIPHSPEKQSTKNREITPLTGESISEKTTEAKKNQNSKLLKEDTNNTGIIHTGENASQPTNQALPISTISIKNEERKTTQTSQIKTSLSDKQSQSPQKNFSKTTETKTNAGKAIVPTRTNKPTTSEKQEKKANLALQSENKKNTEINSSTGNKSSTSVSSTTTSIKNNNTNKKNSETISQSGEKKPLNEEKKVPIQTTLQSSNTKSSQTGSSQSQTGKLTETTKSTSLPQELMKEISSEEQLKLLGGIKAKITLLEKMFTQSPNKKIAQILLEAYLLDHQFNKAKTFYASLPETIRKQLNKKREFKIWLNAFSQIKPKDYLNLKVLFFKLDQEELFSLPEKTYYETIFALIEKRYQDAKNKLATLSSGKYKSFSQAIHSAFIQYENLKDIPTYYQDALIAYQLMQQGIIAGAKKMVLPIVNAYPNYILPYQILAHCDFLTEKRESSATYFSKLITLHPEGKSTYLYYLGASYYHLKQYEKAVLYLTQIVDNELLLDSDRYLILSYLALGEQKRVFSGRKRLLGYDQLKKSDFYAFFEEALWKPYRLGKKSSYLSNAPKLVKSFLSACTQYLKGEDQEICNYGKIGYTLHTEEKITNLETQLLHLAKKSPQSDLFQALGMLYFQKGEQQQSISLLMRAFHLAKTSEEKQYLKEQILKNNS